MDSTREEFMASLGYTRVTETPTYSNVRPMTDDQIRDLRACRDRIIYLLSSSPRIRDQEKEDLQADQES